MAVDPRLAAQLAQLERENQLLDEQIAGRQKAAKEAPPPSLASRFMDAVRGAADYAKQEIQTGIVAPAQKLGHDVMQDYRTKTARIGQPLPNPVEAVKQAAGDFGRDLGIAADTAGVLMSPISTVAHAALQRPYGAAVSAATGGRYSAAQAEHDMGLALMALGPKGARAGAIADGLKATGVVAPEHAPAAGEVIAKRLEGPTGDEPALSVKDAGTALEPYRPREVVPANDNADLFKQPEPKPQEAPQGSPGTDAPAANDNPASGQESGPSGGAGKSANGDNPGSQQSATWDNVDWGKMRSPERAAAAEAHIEFLKKYVRPENIKDFVAALDETPKDGQLGGGDRVGSINPRYVDWEKLNANPEDILQWTNVRASIFKDLYDKAGDATKTWEQIDRTSHLFGTRMSDLVKTHADITGEGGIAARVAALRNVALESADAFHEQLTKARAAMEKGDYTGVNDLAASIQRVVLMDAMAEGAVSEVARSLNYMKRLARPKAALNDLQSVLSEFGDAVNGGKAPSAEELKRAMDSFDAAYRKRGATGVVQEAQKLRELGFSDYVNYVVIGSLLSAPKTYIRNLVGTPILATFQVAEHYLGAGLGAAREGLGLKVGERMTFAEANAYLSGAIRSLHEGFGAAWAAFKSGAPVTDGNGSYAGEVLQRPVPFAFSQERMADWVKRGFSFHTGLDMLGVAFFETLRTVAFRPMVAMDEFYKAVGRRAQLDALATREALYRSRQAPPGQREAIFNSTRQAILQEPTGAAFKAARSFFAEKDLDPNAVYPQGSREEELATLMRSVDIRKMAEDHARLYTFQDSTKLTDAFDHALRMVPIVRWFYVPFFKTPMSLIRAGLIDRNPATLGLMGRNREAFGSLIEAARSDHAALERGGAEADLAAARLMAGSAFMSFAFMLWANGHLVGRRGEQGSPTKLDGVLDYSLRLPGGTWVQYSSMDPVIGSQLGLIADLAQTLRDRPLSDGQATALIGGVAAAVRNNLLNKSALQGLKAFFDTFYGNHADSNDKSGGKAVVQGLEKSAMNFVPFVSLLRNTAQTMDPTVRDARSLMDQIKATVPGYSETLPAKRDVWGRPVVRKPGQVGLFQAFATSRPTDDPLDLELSRLAKSIPDFDMSAGSNRFNQQEITAAEQSKIAEIRGQLYRDHHGLNMEEAALNLIASDRYGEWTDERRGKELKDLVSKYREAADAQIRNPNSEFYMPEMVARTASAQVQKEAADKGLTYSRIRHRARALGMSTEDASRIADILQP